MKVECIINSRPLTRPSCDPDDLDPLTPNHILTMKSKVVSPPPSSNFQKENVYLCKRWRRVQYLANVFWSRWRKEYVQCAKNEMESPKQEFRKGDLLLIADDWAARNDWPMARIVDSCPHAEGHMRSVRVTKGTTTPDRPVHKLDLILEKDA